MSPSDPFRLVHGFLIRFIFASLYMDQHLSLRRTIDLFLPYTCDPT